MSPSAVFNFPTIAKATSWLAAELRPSDVLLLRSRGEFHLERINFSLLGAVGCTMERCPIVPECDVCEHLHFQAAVVPADAIRPLPPSG